MACVTRLNTMLRKLMAESLVNPSRSGLITLSTRTYTSIQGLSHIQTMYIYLITKANAKANANAN